MPETIPIRSKKAGIPGTLLAFTAKRIEEYECPPGVDRIELRDANCKGLRLRVTAAGVKTFCTVRRVNGRLARITIGKLGDVTLEKARKEVAKLGAKIADGEDPRAAKREARHGLTFGELAKDFLDTYTRCGQRTKAEYKRQLESYLKPWDKRLLSELARHHVSMFHSAATKEHGPFIANRLLATLSKLFNFAMNDRGWKGTNPCRGIQKNAEAKRERFLQPDEMPAFFEAVNAEPNETIRDFVFIALFCGARRSNTQAMRWDELDLDQQIWTIPTTKSGKPVRVPLSKPALDILKARKAAAQSEYVFPGKSYGHLQEPKAAWKAILARAGIDGLRIHDLRRSFGSWQAIGGSSLPIIGAALGHKSTASTAIYARLHIDPIRESINSATDAILEAAARKDGGE